MTQTICCMNGTLKITWNLLFGAFLVPDVFFSWPASLFVEMFIPLWMKFRPVDGWNPANQLRLVGFSHYWQGFSTVPGGCLGFQPSTVLPFPHWAQHLCCTRHRGDGYGGASDAGLRHRLRTAQRWPSTHLALLPWIYQPPPRMQACWRSPSSITFFFGTFLEAIVNSNP